MKKRRFLPWLLLGLMFLPFAAEAQTLTYGTGTQFAATNPQSSAVAAIDATHAIIVYGDSSANKGYARMADISGTGITLHTVYEYSSSYVSLTQVAALDDTHAVIVYKDANDNNTGKVMIATISGSTLSFGSAVSVATDIQNGIGYGFAIAKLDSTHFVLAYDTDVFDMMMGTNTYTGNVIAGSVSGTTITLGSAQTFTNSNSYSVSITALDSTHFVFASEAIGKVQAGTVSGTSITLGTAVSNDSGYPFLGKIDSTHFLLNTVANPEHVRIGTLSGTTITLGSSLSYASTATSYGATAVLNATHAILLYANDALPVTMSGTTVTAGTAAAYTSSASIPFASALGNAAVIIGFTSGGKGYVVAGADLTGPDPVTDLAATPSGSTVSLSWTNPTNDDFASITVRRSTSSYPASITDGTAVTSGSTATSYDDTGLANGTYYYSIFALDTSGNVSIVDTISATVNVPSSSSSSSSSETHVQSGGSRGGLNGPTQEQIDQAFTQRFGQQSGTSSSSSVNLPTTSDNPVEQLLLNVRTRLEARIQERIAANPDVAQLLNAVLARLDARIAKWLTQG